MKKTMKNVQQDLLFEIGCEELPATNLADIFESIAVGAPNPLAEKLKKAFEEKRLPFGSCRVWATSRRVVFLVNALAAAQSAKANMTRVLSKQESRSEERRVGKEGRSRGSPYH